MALTLTQQANQQLAPAYNQQIQATQAQIPAITQLYQALFQGLEGQGRVQRQGIFEDTSARGVLRSTLPVDLQTGLSQALIQKRGELSGQQAQDIGKVQSSLADINVNRANAIAQLVNALRTQALESSRFSFERQQASRELALQRALANRQYQLDRQLLAVGG